MKKIIIETIDLGLKEYRHTLDLQLKLREKLIDSSQKLSPYSENYLILVEHPPVITLGLHADLNNILTNRQDLKSKGIDIINIKRGGDVTYHAPGQLVAYPILNLRDLRLNVKNYVKLIEESIILTLEEFGIKGERKEGAPGVWIKKGEKKKKICALGLNSHKYCVMHGLALNVNIDLEGFKFINPCGYNNRDVTSIQEQTGEAVAMSMVKDIFSNIFFSLIFSF